MSSPAKRIGSALGLGHLAGFLIMVVLTRESADPQGALLWVIFAVIDFPITLLYFLGKAYGELIKSFRNPFLEEVLYLPYLVHGVVGTVWWFALPRLLTPKKMGGIWGKRVGNPNGGRS